MRLCQKHESSLPRMDKERYQKSEDILVDCLISSLIGSWNMNQKSNVKHVQRGIFGYSQNRHARICNRRIQSSFEEMKTNVPWT